MPAIKIYQISLRGDYCDCTFRKEADNCHALQRLVYRLTDGYYLGSRICLCTDIHEGRFVTLLHLLPHLQPFGIGDGLELLITRRGAAPLGGGEVQFLRPVVKQLKTLTFVKAGRTKRIRGIAYPDYPLSLVAESTTTALHARGNCAKRRKIVIAGD
ncbi:hypothetical protein M422DRAFT_240763 [Sphaerobolus stellatus SS14]|nr:hypothetical protein M422DRAFT_240763 [Sphaerobolus stellatus SS14]